MQKSLAFVSQTKTALLCLLLVTACNEKTVPNQTSDGGKADGSPSLADQGPASDGGQGNDGTPPARDAGSADSGTACSRNAPCAAAAQFCQTSTGCLENGAQGTCQDKPEDCDTSYEPVCGCDDQTYGNLCQAFAAGTNVQHNGTCGNLTCSNDLDCEYGSQWCENGTCVDCDNSGLACDLACAANWEMLQRNGCVPCQCAPVNQCLEDADCTSGQTCYAGAMCWDWCPEDDPSCCHGNVCSGAGCEGQVNPAGCWTRGCPLGQVCVDQGCSASACGCDSQYTSWYCTDDCGGGVCVAD